jgi:hypothetical protein
MKVVSKAIKDSIINELIKYENGLIHEKDLANFIKKHNDYPFPILYEGEIFNYRLYLNRIEYINGEFKHCKTLFLDYFWEEDKIKVSNTHFFYENINNGGG